MLFCESQEVTGELPGLELVVSRPWMLPAPAPGRRRACYRACRQSSWLFPGLRQV